MLGRFRNFSVQPGTAKSGVDYSYNSPPPLFWVACDSPRPPSPACAVMACLEAMARSRMSSTFCLRRTRPLTNWRPSRSPSSKTPDVGQPQCPVPTGQSERGRRFYLGGQNIPLGAALGPSAAPFTRLMTRKIPARSDLPPPIMWPPISSLPSAWFGAMAFTGSCPCMLSPPTERPLWAQTTKASPTSLSLSGESGQHHLHGYHMPNGLQSTAFAERPSIST